MEHTLVGTFCVKRRKGKECVGSGFSLGGRSEKVLALHWAESIATLNTSHFMRNHGLIRPITFCPCFSNCLFVVFTLRWIFLRILTVDFYAIFKIVYQSNIYFFARNLRSFPVQFIKHYLETPCYWKRMNSSLSLSIRFFFLIKRSGTVCCQTASNFVRKPIIQRVHHFLAIMLEMYITLCIPSPSGNFPARTSV